MKGNIVWDIKPCSKLKSNYVSEEYFASNFRVEEYVKQQTNLKMARLGICFRAGFLLSLVFDPKDGGYMVLRNVR
jgi:hypothetical protein